MSGVFKYCKNYYERLQRHLTTCVDKKSCEDAEERSYRLALAKLKAEVDLEKLRIIMNATTRVVCKCEEKIERRFEILFEVARMVPSNIDPGFVIEDLHEMIRKTSMVARFYEENSVKPSFSDGMYKKLYENTKIVPRSRDFLRKNKRSEFYVVISIRICSLISSPECISPFMFERDLVNPGQSFCEIVVIDFFELQVFFVTSEDIVIGGRSFCC